MRVTNRLGLPAAFVNAVSVRRHNAPGCYSATTLNKGVKEIVLTDRHFDELEVDAADSVWAVWGTAVHTLFQAQDEGFLVGLLRSFIAECKNDPIIGDDGELEKDERPLLIRLAELLEARIKAKFSKDTFVEERFEVPLSKSKITGQVDSYDMASATIYDWKTASVWKVVKADFADWKAQGMTYAWLMAQKGLPVKKCRFVALLKDHSKTKAATDASYPQSPVFVYEFDVTEEGLKETGDRLEKKVIELETASLLEDKDIPPCSESERWAEPPVWAVMKNGRKSAVKLFDSEADADAFAGEMGNSHYVEHRPAVSRKCADYCPCKDFCNFYKAIKEAGQ